MSILTLFFIAVGLSMDALAISVASGIAIHRLRLRHAMLVAFFFGASQAVMPVLGWMLGCLACEWVSAYDHYIAFGLLSAIGVKMILEAFKLEEEKTFDPLNLGVLLLLAVATSLDAFAVGLTLTFLNVGIIMPAVIIGLVTFFICLAGVYIGDYFGHLFENKLEILGGIVLIGIDVKILLEHTVLN